MVERRRPCQAGCSQRHRRLQGQLHLETGAPGVRLCHKGERILPISSVSLTVTKLGRSSELRRSPKEVMCCRLWLSKCGCSCSMREPRRRNWRLTGTWRSVLVASKTMVPLIQIRPLFTSLVWHYPRALELARTVSDAFTGQLPVPLCDRLGFSLEII